MKTFTVNDAARLYSRTPSRIRQICIAGNIGRLIANRVRLLSRRDVERIGRVLEATGRKNGEVT